MRALKRTLLTVASVFGGISGGNAYEVGTHQILTGEALSRSVLALDPSVIADIGMPGLEAAYPMVGGYALGSSLVQYGALAEDGNNTDDSRRVFNHFYDVQFNNFSGRGMNVLTYTGNASPTWAIEDTGDVTDHTHGRAQQYSIRQLQQYYYAALTVASPGDRQLYFSNVLQSLGHIVHHIQDMAQPQHVRNDQHVHPIPFTDIYPQWSFYERYSERVLNSNKVRELANTNYPIPTFATSREFWHTPGVTTARYVGMAEFTSNNYVSYGKTFRSTWRSGSSVDIFPHPLHPLPGTHNVDGTRKTVATQNVTVTLTNGTQRTGPMDFVMGKIWDPNHGGIIDGQRLASVSVLDMVASGASYGTMSGRANVFKENSAVYDDQHRILIPRAVSFSAGLINHMFRGRLDLVRTSPTSSSYTITNLSRTMVGGSPVGQRINGTIKLYYDDAAQVRRAMPGASSSAVDLAYGASVNIGDTVAPADTQRIIAVFHGRIGVEGEPSANPATGFFAVAGKVIDYSRPEIPCGQNPDSTGYAYHNYVGDGRGMNNGGTENPGLMDLGSKAGRVYGEFNSRWVSGATRWSITVRRGSANGSLLYSSGFFSGYREFSFSYAGGYEDDQRKIHVRLAPEISPNTTESNVWRIQVLCPGLVFTDDNRAEKRIPLPLSVSVAPGFCQRGNVEFFLDDNPVGRVELPSGGLNGATRYVWPLSPTVTAGSHHLRAAITSTNDFGCGGVLNVGWTGGDEVRRTFNAGGENIQLPEQWFR